MAQPKMPGILSLPPELLLQIARHLRARVSCFELVHLSNLCLVSKKLYPVAQEELYAGAILPSSCGCHPTVNAALKLLRTLLERPVLAVNIKALRLSVVRRSVGKLCTEKGFDLQSLRRACLAELTKFGYEEWHPWCASLKNDLESAYGGVLLCILPNLDDLQFTVKDHHHRAPSMHPVTAFFGTSIPPDAMVTAMKPLQKLCVLDATLLQSMSFENLNILQFQLIDASSLLELNGPNTFRGTTQLSQLWCGIPVQFLDEEYMDGIQVGFRDLIDAFGCHTLSTLKLRIVNLGYCFLQDPTFNIEYLMDQLSCVESTLKSLEIDLNLDDESDSWAWVLSHCENPPESLENFANLERLTIPYDFLDRNLSRHTVTVRPQNLPQKLRRLEVVSPNREFIDWASAIPETPHVLPHLRTMVLTCRDGVGTPAYQFSRKVNPLFLKLLKDCDIETYVSDLDANTSKSLVDLYKTSPLLSDDEDEWMDFEDDDEDDGEDDNDGDSDDDSDDEMPDLESPGPSIGTSILSDSPLVDDMD